MKKLLITAMAASLAFATTAALADSMLKAGLWEVHVVKQVMDGRDMSAQMAAAQSQMQQMMANMSPAQRKQMEQMMGKKAMPSSGANRICVSQEMASRDKPMMPPDAKCEPTKFERSGNKTSFTMNCTTEGRTMAGKGESIASGDTISTRMDMTMTDARGTHTMQSESQMKFLGTDCQGVTPMDQLVKEMQASRKK